MIGKRRGIAAIIFLVLAAIANTNPLAATVTAGAHQQGHAIAQRTSAIRVRAFALGDSVMLAAQADLERRGIAVDAVESRQFIQGIDILRWMRASGRLPREVVVHLGTNGPITSETFDSMMQNLHGIPLVVFLTVKEPRWWQGTVNGVIEAGVARWRHTRLVNWYALSVGHPEWFWDDGIHLRPEGAAAYAQIVSAALG